MHLSVQRLQHWHASGVFLVSHGKHRLDSIKFCAIYSNAHSSRHDNLLSLISRTTPRRFRRNRLELRHINFDTEDFGWPRWHYLKKNIADALHPLVGVFVYKQLI